MTHDDHMETITDPAAIRATDDPDEPRAPLVPDATLDYLIAKYGHVRPDERAVAVDREAATAMLNAANTVKATGGAVEIGGVRIEPCDEFGSTVTTARAESAEAEVVTLRAKVAAVEALAGRWKKPLNGARQRANTGDDFAAIADIERVRGECADDLRAALATTGQGK
jgi:hypothetical protein